MRKPLGLSVLICFIITCESIISCSEKEDNPVAVQQEAIKIPTVKPEDLPPPIKAKYLDPDSIKPPEVIPLKHKPTVTPAHPNVYPIGTPRVTRIPDELHIVTIGIDVPMPEVIPAQPKIVPAHQPKPIPALSSRMRDGAIYNMQYLSEDEGLDFITNVNVIEDSKGHIWTGSHLWHIARYDGEHFFLMSPQEGFGGGRVLMEDSKGRIWFGGWYILGYYDGTNVFHFGEQEALKGNLWTSIFEDSKGYIWLGSSTKGIYRYDPNSSENNQKGNFTLFKIEDILPSYNRKEYNVGTSHIRINDVIEDRNGHIWWATQGNGVLRYDINKGRIIHYTEKEGLISNYIQCLLEDSKGQIWIGSGGERTPASAGKGISIYKGDTTAAHSLVGTFTNYTTNEGLSENRITGMVEDDQGKIWIATNNGMTCYAPEDNKEGSFIQYTTEEGLKHNSIISIMKDRKKNIWLGLNRTAGIMRFKPNSFRHFTEKQGLTKNWVVGCLEDRKGNIWIGTTYGGLLKYDGQNFISFSLKEELLGSMPNPLLEDRQGNIWFSIIDRGIALFDGKEFKLFGKEQGLVYPNIEYVHQDKQGQIWITSSRPSGNSMITRYDPKSQQMTRFANDEDGVGNYRTIEDKDGQLWFGGIGSRIFKYDPINDQMIYALQLDVERHDWTYLLFEDDKDNLWFSMNNERRVFKMKKNGDNAHIMSYDQELPDYQVTNVSIDSNKNIWFSGNGIGVYPKGAENFGSPEQRLIQYDKADGLKAMSYIGDVDIVGENQLWAGTDAAGITVLDLNTFEFPTEAPQNMGLSHIHIEEQFIDFTRLSDTSYSSTLAFGAVLNKSIEEVPAFKNYPTTLNLPFDLNHLTFHFSAIDWDAPHDIQYSFKMEGLDKEWSPSSDKAEADYRNIPFGSYTFKVKSIGKAKIWSEPFEYTFTVLPPWWHSWWAYALYALIFASAMILYTRRFQRQVQQKQEQLEREQSLNIELKELNIATNRFVPSDFLKILGKEKLKDLKLGDQVEIKMTILFADIRDYTGISENMPPEDIFKLINSFLSRMGPIIKEHNGFICHYFGDGIMALFRDNHGQAVKTAIEMQKALERYNRTRSIKNRRQLKLGIGLNTGNLILGVIGDEKRYDSSVISDAVNTASRMEGLTKIFGCQVIVSEKTLIEMELNDDGEGLETVAGDFRFLGKVKVKGKNIALKIYDFYSGELEHIKNQKTKTKNDFERALNLYYNRNFGKAADIFKTVNEEFPEDRATIYYLDKSVHFVINGVDEKWNGVEQMVSK